MPEINIFYATNRKHQGRERFRPKGYGADFSADGLENLRFGKVSVQADARKIQKGLNETSGGGPINGETLAAYLSGLVGKAKIEAYRERLDRDLDENQQPGKRLGSDSFFRELQKTMKGGTDVVVYIHGFNVSWKEAVGSAMALQTSLNRPDGTAPLQKTNVVLFSWPSDGLALPYTSYKSDRSEAKCSGYAVGRALLRLRDFLVSLRRFDADLCNQQIHLLSHSMGNYVLQEAIQRLGVYTPGSALPRMFEHIFMCAPDVDDNALESNQPFGCVHQLARKVTVYHNRDDKALYVSAHTKGNPERLGTNGPAHPAGIHQKIEHVDTTEVTLDNSGWIKHSYYLSGSTNLDIRHSLEGISSDDPRRNRRPNPRAPRGYLCEEVKIPS